MLYTRLITVFLIVFTLLSICYTSVFVESYNGEEPLYIAIVWHQHQPFYIDPSGKAYMPWLRLHAAKDYFKMAWLSKLYPDIHVTIDLTGSLLIQLQEFIRGRCNDTQYVISWKIARGEELSIEDKWRMLQIPGGFFDINWENNVYPHKRYRDLLEKRNQLFNEYKGLPLDEMMEKITSGFDTQDYIDLAVLFNMYWMNPLVVEKLYPDIWSLWRRGDIGRSDPSYKPFTRDDLRKILFAHIDQARKAIEIHRELQENGTIEVITTPYAHPLAPLLVDMGLESDLEIHVVKAISLYKSLFNVTPRGLWSPENAVNEGVLRIYSLYGISWTITDPRVGAYADPLFISSGRDGYDRITRPYYVEFNGSRLYVFFREWVLSDKIGFTYSQMDPGDAVDDFIDTLLSIREMIGGGRVVVIALDGENPWDHYPNDGVDFLVELYDRLSSLQKIGVIKTVTISEYLYSYGGVYKAVEFPTTTVTLLDLKGVDLRIYSSYSELPRKSVLQKIPEGSWSGGSLELWIGEPQENYAWMHLLWTRNTLYNYVSSRGWEWLRPSTWDKGAREALEYLLRAEGSDWYWGYGDDITGGYDYVGDMLVKSYLRMVYKCIGLKPPDYLVVDYYPDGEPYGLEEPYRIGYSYVTPVVDGVLGESEWSGATVYLSSIVDAIYIGFDCNSLYIGFSNNIGYNIVVDLGFYGDYNASYLDPLGYSSGFMVSYSIVGDKLLVYRSGEWISYDVIVARNKSIEYSIPVDTLRLDTSKALKLYLRVFVLGENNSVLEKIPGTNPGYILLKPCISGELVFSYNDPIGDDHGPGSYTYPTNPVFQPGVFDLVYFRVYDEGDSIRFVFGFRELGGNPWSAPYGFSLQIIEVYIDIVEGEGATWASTGSNIAISERDAWEIGFRVAGWSYGNTLWLPDHTVVNGVLEYYVDTGSNEIHAILPKRFTLPNGSVYTLPDPDNSWEYIVIVGSQDGYGVDYWRPVDTEASEWRIGGDDPEAIALGIVPRVIDMLSPPWTSQEEMLSSYSIEKKTKAIVYGVGCRGETPTMTPTTSQSPLVTPSPTIPTSSYTSGLTLGNTSTNTSLQTSYGRELDDYLLLAIAVILLTIVVSIMVYRAKRK